MTEKSEKRVVKTVRVMAEKDDPVPTELISAEIQAIAEGMRRIDAGRLNQKALVLLVSEASGVGKPAVRGVLDTLRRLDMHYLRPGEKAKGGRS